VRKSKKQKRAEKLLMDQIIYTYNTTGEEMKKPDEQLLTEFDQKRITQSGVTILLRRGFRDELLARAVSTEEREVIWFLFLFMEEFERLKAAGYDREKAGQAREVNALQRDAALLARESPEQVN